MDTDHLKSNLTISTCVHFKEDRYTTHKHKPTYDFGPHYFFALVVLSMDGFWSPVETNGCGTERNGSVIGFGLVRNERNG